MFGSIFEILEDFVVENQGIDVWHSIKEKAGCGVKDNGFLTRSYYPDRELTELVAAASEVLKLGVPDVLQAYGKHFIRYHFAKGYEGILRCQGSTLRQWLSNLNAMHDHIQKTFEAVHFVAPVFWCEDCENVEGSILLHYYSLRGNLLAPIVVGIVEELSLFLFELQIKMNQLALQGIDEAEFTTWRIAAVNESEKWKLSPTSEEHHITHMNESRFSMNADMQLPSKCPFSGKDLSPRSDIDNTYRDTSQSSLHSETKQSTTTKSLSSSGSDAESGLSLQQLREVFPFHVLVDIDFKILQLGKSLPDMLNLDGADINGKQISDFLEITRPVLGSDWNWKALHKLADQHFFVVPKINHTASRTKKRASFSGERCLRTRVSMVDNLIIFKSTIIWVSSEKVMFVLSPHARDVDDLNRMGLTLSDLPLSGCQRDTVFLGEYITQEMNKAHELDKLSKRLHDEKTLSNTLLYNMLPKSVANTLRSGHTVEPKHFDKVTLFFSDIEGFTSLCDHVQPWQVIVMLNQLYTVMDYLATRFNLYKVETIGDAYMCCSGLPEPDSEHAENIADFAIAVIECVKHVRSPLDGTPINLRIGIHTGHCTAGVVGILTPHYCLFGDMVNTTARHESTGVAGKIQCSSVLFHRLRSFSKHRQDQYKFRPRGPVSMKGKGKQYTYWLEGGTDCNNRVNSVALRKLVDDVDEMLGSGTWKNRRYFRRSASEVCSADTLSTDSEGSTVSAITPTCSDSAQD